MMFSQDNVVRSTEGYGEVFVLVFTGVFEREAGECQASKWIKHISQAMPRKSATLNGV